MLPSRAAVPPCLPCIPSAFRILGIFFFFCTANLHPTWSPRIQLQAAASTTAPRLSRRRASGSSAVWRRRRLRAGAPPAPELAGRHIFG